MTTASDIARHFERMRAAVFNTTEHDPLINLPRTGSRRVLSFKGSAYATRSALLSQGNLLIGEMLQPEVPLADASPILKEMIAEDRKLQDRQGLPTIHLGLGIVAWEETDGAYCFAPLFLHPVELVAEHGSILVKPADTNSTLNEMLLARLGLTRDQVPEDLPESAEIDLHPRIGGLEDRWVLGIFNQTRRAMARRLDLQHNPKLLTHRTLRRLVLASRGNLAAETGRSNTPVEHKVAPAGPNIHRMGVDTFQDEVITDTRADCPELLVQGPPGTGKSQTIASIILNAVQDNKSVLVLAEKRNAIEAIWKRLGAHTNPGDVLMLQGDGLNRTLIAEALGIHEAARILDMLEACPEPSRPKAILTSPVAFALYVPEMWEFDILVVDEASQILLSSAAAAVSVSRQIIVCGDSQQMPPDVPSSLDGGPDSDKSQTISLLTAAENASFPVRMLRYHYRSRHPALIDPSNRLFYNARLRIVPSPLPVDRYGVKFHKVDGLYGPDSGTNLVEAKQILDAMRRCIAEIKKASANGRRFPLSLGVIAMNDAQCQLIASLIEECPEINDLKDDVELFIKPIDDVQGEERDIILISLTYGRTSNNVLHPNLGLVSAPSGDKRVNVLMTRSRCRTEIFSSFDHTDWQATTSPGIEALRFYMINAQRGPQGYHGRPCTAPLVDWLKWHDFTFDHFGHAIRVRHGKDSKRNVGILYFTGQCSELDQASEIAQFKGAGWTVLKLPHEFLKEENPRETEVGKRLWKNFSHVRFGASMDGD